MHVFSKEPMPTTTGLHISLLGNAWAILLDNNLPPQSFKNLCQIRLAGCMTRLLVYMPNTHSITHLAFPCDSLENSEPDHLLPLLDELGFEKVVIEILKTAEPSHRVRVENWVTTMRKTEERIYLLHSPSHVGGFVDTREVEEKNGESFWDRASCYTVQWERNASEYLLSTGRPLLINSSRIFVACAHVKAV